MNDYSVTVRGMAVNKFTCLLSILERYEQEISIQGWGRLVTCEHFIETYNAIPSTIDTIEKSTKVNTVEIYKRGSTPQNPILIYSSKDPNKTYPNAKYAMQEQRNIEKNKFIHKAPEINKKINHISSLLDKKTMSCAEEKLLNNINQLNNEYINIKSNNEISKDER